MPASISAADATNQMMNGLISRAAHRGESHGNLFARAVGITPSPKHDALSTALTMLEQVKRHGDPYDIELAERAVVERRIDAEHARVAAAEQRQREAEANAPSFDGGPRGMGSRYTNASNTGESVAGLFGRMVQASREAAQAEAASVAGDPSILYGRDLPRRS